MRIWPLAMGAGVAAGAVAVMMMPKNSSARRMASQAAEKVEGAVYHAVDKMTSNTTS